CQAPFGSGSGAARKKSPSVFVANRACHPDLPQLLPHVYGILTCTTYHSQLKFSDGAWVASHWAAKLRLAVAAELPERKALRSLWQTELATP
ncbi:MAG: hypothetical protein LHW48_07045, partial [Candidatus Cloacimonetes bacterium]|nr:hypothetical protein [Candidatus Cloacimonadota bacterium]